MSQLLHVTQAGCLPIIVLLMFLTLLLGTVFWVMRPSSRKKYDEISTGILDAD